MHPYVAKKLMHFFEPRIHTSVVREFVPNHNFSRAFFTKRVKIALAVLYVND